MFTYAGTSVSHNGPDTKPTEETTTHLVYFNRHWVSSQTHQPLISISTTKKWINYELQWMRTCLHSNKVLFHASNQTKKKWNILIIIDNKTRFVLLSLFPHFSDLTPGTNLMNKSWSNAACARQHIIIWNYISSSNVNTPKHLWWKNTHAFQIVHRDQT